jgi:DNA-binding NarL/FixJ family response regulator
MALRILLADDHHIVRQGLKAFLEREGFTVVGEASDGQEAIRVARSLRPDVAILDLGMPGLNGITAASRIVRESETTKPILLTMHTDDIYVAEAFRAGVRGYVVKSQIAEDLLEAIRTVTALRTYVSPTVSDAVIHALLDRTEVASATLSLRETEVLQLLAEGRTSKETAVTLGIGIRTVETHRRRTMEKLGIRDRSGLVRYAIRHGVIQP